MIVPRRKAWQRENLRSIAKGGPELLISERGCTRVVRHFGSVTWAIRSTKVPLP